jgi:lysophospholipase L1-like esterase
MKSLIATIVFLLLSSSLFADPVTVALAGDSLTVCYQYYGTHYWDGTGYDVRYWDGTNYVTPFAYAGDPPPCSPWAISGQSTSHFAGVLPISENGQPATYHDEGQEIADLNPDYVWFMLGTNDSHSNSAPEQSFANFKVNIDYAFSKMQGIQHVIVASILPKIGEANANSDWRITNWYNPYLHAEAYKYGFDYYDINYILRSKPNMADYYYVDGVHLNSSPGYVWLSQSFDDRTKESLDYPSDLKILSLSPGENLSLDNCRVDSLIIGPGAKLTIEPVTAGTGGHTPTPEPSTFVLLGMGALSLLACACRRRT